MGVGVDEGMWFLTALVQLSLVRQVAGVKVTTPEDAFAVL
jgi:hypothetical protein